MPRNKPDWSRRLPKPIKVDRRTLRTLQDVADFLERLPEERRRRTTWQGVIRYAIEAAEGGDLRDLEIDLFFARALRH